MSAAIERYLAACVQQCESAWGLPEAAEAPDGVWSQILGGPLTAAVLGERAVPMPAALPAALAIPASVPAARLRPPVLVPEAAEQRWLVAVYCAAEGARRDVQAGALAEAVAAWAAAESWIPLCRAEIRTRHGNLPALDSYRAGPCADDVQARNVFTSELSSRGLAVWAVTWQIDLCVPLTGAAAAAPQPVPRELYAGWSPETGPDHRDDYRRMSP